MNIFKRVLFFAIFGTYLVILAGAVVRGTGSGLGCPEKWLLRFAGVIFLGLGGNVVWTYVI